MKWWKENFLIAEFFLSIAVITITFGLILTFDFQLSLASMVSDIRQQLYGTIASVSGSLLGFVITGMSILLTMGETESIKRLKMSKHYPQIFKVYLSSGKFLALSTVLSIMALIVDTNGAPKLWCLTIVGWAVLISVFRLLRCIWVLENMIGLATKKNQN